MLKCLCFEIVQSCSTIPYYLTLLHAGIGMGLGACSKMWGTMSNLNESRYFSATDHILQS